MRKTWIQAEIPSRYRVDFYNLLEKFYGYTDRFQLFKNISEEWVG